MHSWNELETSEKCFVCRHELDESKVFVTLTLRFYEKILIFTYDEHATIINFLFASSC